MRRPKTAGRLLATLVPGVCAGFAGTAVMTATAAAYARLAPAAVPDEHGHTPVVDFDNSEHVVIAASTILRVDPRSPAARAALFHLVHWGYGSLVGVGLSLLVRARAPAPATLFFLGCQAMATSLFPLAGGTPPPWRWSRAQLAVSLVQHAVYAGAANAALRALCPSRPGPFRAVTRR